MFDLLEIKDPKFLKKLNKEELNTLVGEIRDFLIEKISKTGGHLASNLGVIELEVAMHYVFNSPEDKLIFDVGHQAYTHKILTGRAKDFDTLRQTNGLSGYISRDESIHDIWESGHSSSSISAMAGMELAKSYNHHDGRIITLIGDTSISNGLAFEGLNFLGQFKDLNPIIILNDNGMGIDKSVGSLTNYLTKLRGSKLKRNFRKLIIKMLPNKLTNSFHNLRCKVHKKNVFEDLGFNYFGPYETTDVNLLIKILEKVKLEKGPIILHLVTKKGEGYIPALINTPLYHGVGKFEVETGKIYDDGLLSYGSIVGNYLIKKRKQKEFMVISPAMIKGAGLEAFKENYPEDIYDVGIAEDHAVIMACGLALEKVTPIVSLYSTFTQRAFDAILNDCARGNLDVKFIIDRAGVVGADGETHQGIYDVCMFNLMPNMKLMMGKDASETLGLLDFMLKEKGPMALRYPKLKTKMPDEITKITDYSWDYLTKDGKGIIISYGPDLLKILNLNLDAIIINARFIRPLDTKMLDILAELNLPILVYEQVIKTGSLYEKICAYYKEKKVNINLKGMHFSTNARVKHGNIEEILEINHLGCKDISERFKKMI